MFQGTRYRPSGRELQADLATMCRIRRSFATTLPSELVQCTSRSRRSPGGIDDAGVENADARLSRGIQDLRHMLERTGWLLQHLRRSHTLPPSGDEIVIRIDPRSPVIPLFICQLIKI